MRCLTLVVAGWLLATPVAAQGLNYFVPSGIEIAAGNFLFPQVQVGRTGPVNFATDYVMVGRQFTNVTNSNGVFVGDVNVPNFGYLPLSAFLQQVQQQDPQIVAAVQANTAALVGIATRLDRLASRFREGIALAGAINVLPPEPGKHINISLGAAGYDGTGAGSVAVSYRLRDDVIGYVGVAKGPAQTLVKGGVGWSPW